MLSYRIQHLASGECVTSIPVDGSFELKLCLADNLLQRFTILWDFEKHKFLFYNNAIRAYLDVSKASAVYQDVKESEDRSSAEVELIPASISHYEAWFIKNTYGEYLLGAHEYQSFDTIMDAEHCQLQDFFKFIFVDWNNEFFVPSEEEL
jgi:hypothetical protein